VTPPTESLSEVVRGIPEFREPPTYVQWAGIRLAYWLLAALVGLLVADLGHWFFTAPSISQFEQPITTESLRLYKEASDIAFSRVTTLANVIAGNTLLPVLTFVLGHSFGAQAARASVEGGE